MLDRNDGFTKGITHNIRMMTPPEAKSGLLNWYRMHIYYNDKGEMIKRKTVYREASGVVVRVDTIHGRYWYVG